MHTESVDVFSCSIRRLSSVEFETLTRKAPSINEMAFVKEANFSPIISGQLTKIKSPRLSYVLLKELKTEGRR